MKNFRLLLLLLAAALPVHADDRIRDVQTELKTQGFYYGEIDGSYGTETTAAIRRYQIRNGLEVTGTLTDEMLKSLGIGSAPAPAAPAPAPPAAPQKTKPPVDESDRDFLRREESRQPQPVNPPAARPPLDEPPAAPTPHALDSSSDELNDFFARTPYANAPREVQESTIRRAQSQLASRGFYREAIDGDPGPGTEEALLSFQRVTRLPLTGRLDLETLSALRLLPGRSSAPLKGIPVPPRGGRPTVYRGIWVR